MPFYLDQPRLRRLRQPPGAGVVRGRRPRPCPAAQFSVPGETLEYFVIYGPTPKEILRRVHRADRPAGRCCRRWSFGLWLSTSFTTDYDEATVTRLHRRHGRARHPAAASSTSTASGCASSTGATSSGTRATFPDPPAMLARLKATRAADLRVDQPVHRAALGAVRRGPRAAATWSSGADGDVWQWDKWQAGHGARRLHQPGRRATGIAGKLRALLDHGRRRFKTDFGERIPTRRRLARRLATRSGCTTTTPSSTTGPSSTLLERAARRRRGGRCSRARPPPAASSSRCTGAATATRPSSRWPRSLRGGLSLGLSRLRLLEPRHRRLRGHAGRRRVFKRWLAFGLLSIAQPAARLRLATGCRGRSTRRRSTSLRQFTQLKMSLMPYLFAASPSEAHDATASR